MWEILESRAPLKVRRYRYLESTGSSGKFNGGPGVIKEIETLGEAFLESGMDRTLDPPWPLAGGTPGTPGDIRVLVSGQTEWTSVRRASNLRLPPGSVLQEMSSGGGGWGNPAERARSQATID